MHSDHLAKSYEGKKKLPLEKKNSSFKGRVAYTLHQKIICEMFSKKYKELDSTTASYFYENCIAFINTAAFSSFALMIDEITKFAVFALSSCERNWSAHRHI
jgi:hypothetical protein